MAGFEVIIYGRFWVIAEGGTLLLGLINDGDGKNPSCGRRKAALRQGGSL